MRKTNRDYTGLERTPSSMSFLIDKRRVAAGKLERCQRDFEKLPKEMVRLTAELQTIDAMIRMHDVPVDPDAIEPKRAYTQRIPADSKQVLDAIFECLKLAAGQPRYTTEVAMHVARVLDFQICRSNKREITLSVRKRLKRLHDKDLIECHRDERPGSTDEARWSIAVDVTVAQAMP